MLGAAIATTVGAIDDFRGLAWWQKLGGQVTAAAVPAAFGIYVDRFNFPLLADPYIELPTWLGVGATIVWVVALMNMVNFLDGMDGLAAGVCGIAGFTFAVIALSLGKPTAAVFSAIVAGACFGFLRHNFFPARIFMGDSGALLLGYALATIAIQGLLKTASTVVLFFPLVMLAIPILDTTFVLARRIKHGQKLYAADQSHLHFRFLRRGFSQRRAALTMYAWCVTLAGAAFATRFVPFREGGEWHLWPTLLALAIGLVAVAFSIYVVYVLEIVKLTNRRGRRREEGRAERRAGLALRGVPRCQAPGHASTGRVADERLQQRVERLAEAGDRVARAREHRALRAEALLEDVADGVEGGVVPARDDELGERRRRELVERDHGLVGRALRDRGPSAGLDRGREGVAQVQRRPDEREEELEVARVHPSALPPRSGPRNSSTAGLPRATPKAGGSTTVSEASGARAAASRETTAP